MGQISVYLQALAFMEYHAARGVTATDPDPPEHVLVLGRRLPLVYILELFRSFRVDLGTRPSSLHISVALLSSHSGV